MDRIFFDFLNTLSGGSLSLKDVEDLKALDSRQLLDLSDKLPDELLPLFVRLLKESQGGAELFQRLMGDHDEDNREKVDRFFNRYMALVMEPDEGDYNPLIFYLTPEMFHDLALIQTREQFFKRQTIERINEFLRLHFSLEEEFMPGEQDRAWDFFFQELLLS